MIVVERPGMMTTVRGLGRPGFQSQGVPPGGAADAFALRVANLLVGNLEWQAGLECTLRGPALRFEKKGVVCVTGARVEGVRLGQPFAVKAGEVLRLEKFEVGCRAYVAVSGGLFDRWLAGRSSSAYERAGLGEHEGRALEAGDRLELGGGARVRPGDWGLGPSMFEAAPFVRVVAGPQREWFGRRAWEAFLEGTYRVSGQSNRMGVRLEGATVKLPKARELASEAVALGTVQVPHDGQPIVLLADRPTIGGYPKIANVISVDIGKVAQLRPGDSVRFAEVGLEEADRLLARRERDLAMLRYAMRARE